ncbi:MAG TPA: sigma-70 family RNA polymerase sigma factor [Candidatus Limnocylindrales bacterium]|nr:sigma-70 family RNA polymerase sigma factor [Candidatus Limnocylindrales bacterium]
MTGRPVAAIGEGSTDLEGQLADFFGTHYDRLVRLAALVCHAGVSIEDAVQAAMEQAWRRRHTLRDAERMRPWLDQIVVREAIRLNRRPWWSRFQASPDAPPVPDRRGGVDPTWIALADAFRALPAEQRAVVALHLYEGYSVEETASIMDAGLETTRSRLRLARARLRRELGEDER